MLKGKEHKGYSAADILRYVQGQLSAQEMHAIEKAALDDPFLADAIEGFQEGMQEHGEPLVNDQLQALRNKMQDRTSSKSKTRVIAFRWWQAVAAAVIVIAGAVWIYNSSRSVNMVVAQKQVPGANTHASVPAPAPVATQENQAITPATDSAIVTSVKPKRSTTTAVTKKALKNDAAVENTAPPVAMNQTIEEKDTTQLMANNASAANEYLKKAEEKERRSQALNDALAARQNQVAKNEPAAAAAKKADDFNNRETELITIAKNEGQTKPILVRDKNLSGFVKGRVTDPFNNPVANAYVKMPNNNNYNILTDKTGYFKVPATDSVVDVSVNVVGYGTQNFRLQNNASLNELQLQPANVALNAVEVKAIKSSAKRSKYQTSYPTVMMQDAEPVYGWVSYEQYLENNKNLPFNQLSLKGNVAVSFIVNKKGELSDFKVEQSLAKSYDDEAIRLISQGPAWKLLKGRKARITVIVRF